MMGRVEVTLGVDTLLPLTEAGQCLLGMVHYFQSLLEKEAEEIAGVSLPWLEPITLVPRSSQERRALGECLRDLAELGRGQVPSRGSPSA